jgi:ribosome maturation protein Sdo1
MNKHSPYPTVTKRHVIKHLTKEAVTILAIVPPHLAERIIDYIVRLGAVNKNHSIIDDNHVFVFEFDAKVYCEAFLQVIERSHQGQVKVRRIKNH